MLTNYIIMNNNYTVNKVETRVTYDWNVIEQSEDKANPIYEFNFYIERFGTVSDYWCGSNNLKGSSVVNSKKKVMTINSYMSYDDIILMKELILNEY